MVFGPAASLNGRLLVRNVSAGVGALMDGTCHSSKLPNGQLLVPNVSAGAGALVSSIRH